MAEGVVTQVEMFARRTELPSSERQPTIVESLAYHDDGFGAVATYGAKVDNPYWRGRTCGVCVELERHYGWKPHRWMASVYVELPDEARSWWTEHVICETQDEAALEASDMAAVGIDLLNRCLRRERVETPRQVRERLAGQHADADPGYVRATRDEEAALKVVNEVGAAAPGFTAALMQWSSYRAAAISLRCRLMDEFRGAHQWREFAEVPHVAR